MATDTSNTQVQINFTDSCPYCKGRGFTPRMLFVQALTMRVIETIQPCLLCDAKGILGESTFRDFILRKLAANAHLYNKANRDVTVKKTLRAMFGPLVPRP